MSSEFQLAWPCPHATVEEVVALDTDRRTLPTRQPVAGSTTVRILVNDEFFLPQGGLYSSAVLFGSVSGPFDLIEDEDTLTVTTPSGTATATFGVTGTTRMSADEIINYLGRIGFDVAEVANVNGHLAFSEITTAGTGSYIHVSGTASSTLGFGGEKQRGARGDLVYPGWRLYTRPDEIVNRYPRFDAPIRNNPNFKVSYTVPPSRCLRCGGTYVENDYRYDTSGQAILIQNEDLLYQATLKALLTERGSNPYHPWYGARLKSFLGSKAVSGAAALISEDVRRTLAQVQTLQDQQARYQNVSFKERLYAVQSVTVSPHTQDPTTYLVDVVVMNASREPINLSIVFTVPSVVSIMGSNGLMLGPEIAGLDATKIAGLFGGH